MNALGSIRRILMDRRMGICMATGFASGLPLYIIMQLIPAWLRLEGVSLTAIGFFTAVQLLCFLLLIQLNLISFEFQIHLSCNFQQIQYYLL